MRLSALLIAFLLPAGCMPAIAPILVVEGHAARPDNYPDPTGSVTYYSADDLDRIAKEFVSGNSINFSFRGTQAQFFAAKDRGCMVYGIYASGLGKPVLEIEIGWDGRVKKHSIAVAACGGRG